ncbi:DNA topoisomerase IV subunit B [Bacillus sp. 1006-3]|uniref:DNA topoisomerase IV subunit B n=1 Tax=Bacillus sp. 1006-3 TaxID=2922309 RepID=UPI001F0FF17E|nr:DNA topoisomerase IV subunit B [Bacillus sp. 1006-3]MCH4866627.1 DNA topoisomerase IV subunit B [Bacillus sp. 1006-3]
MAEALKEREVVLNEYNDDSIQVLEGLEAVRKRPGMYIGSTDRRGLHHLVYEIFDNAVDEALAGFGSEIVVTLNKDASVTVRDFGRGVPTGMSKDRGVSTAEVIFTVLHAGGKFGQGGYKSSGGLHGVGSSVVNALSVKMSVRIFRDGKEHLIEFENGGKVKTPLKAVGKTKEQGTEVTFLPDPDIFSTTRFTFDTLSERLRETAFLMKNMKVTLRDDRADEPKEEVYHYERGLADFVDYLNQDKNIVSPVQFYSGEAGGVEIDTALQWNEGYTETIYSFVNNVRTKDGGTHETGFKTALTRAMNDYAKGNGFLKSKDNNLEGGDIREGIVGIVSVRVPENILQFEGQTKGKLGTSEVRSLVDNFFYDKVTQYMQENPKIAEHLIKKAIKAQKVREEARKARDRARNNKKSKRRHILTEKLTDATSKDVSERQLFLVEGDSAGGTAKKARDRKTQGILSLRGKVLNTEKASLSKLLKNQELQTIIHAVGGTGLGEEFTLETVNYDKIIIMTDADTDGSHIQTLLLTFFYRYMTKLIEAGKVYIALPPLYAVKKKGHEVQYCWNQIELSKITKELKSNYEIKRFKGLGEMSADELWDTTLNPENRTLIQVGLDNFVQADRTFSTLMGDDTDARKRWLEENVDFELDE